MKKEDIHLGDWQRMFFGEVPGGFYWEVVLRIAVIYLILMVSMRLMGKRMASQLSRNEMIALVSLSAAIGVPLQAPDRGILAAVVIAAAVILIQQQISRAAFRNETIESVTQGEMSVLVMDGRLKLSSMKVTGITWEKVFSQLRSRSIRHLGEVKRLYFEADGTFTMVRETEVQPGLSILPEIDDAFARQVSKQTHQVVCRRCGQTHLLAAPRCSVCSGGDFVPGVV
jgi:uncharacterized membrane protein YcaP (DUF421 family)